MKITLPLLLAFLLCSASLFAQNTNSIKGSVVDTESVVKLYNATVTVLTAKDSILVKSTRATESGTFSISGIPVGKYFILVSYPDYADYVEQFTIDPAHPSHDFSKVNLRLKEKILKEVQIKGEAIAIKINGDTTEFNAKAYKIQPNDKVEDLIKQLPGMQVDKDGNITANGQTVSKVLLDGEEFFGDDPKLVTRNIRADMVDKMQLYDKKSDQATFTGIDDGNTTKVLNVKLKEDKKVGLFGKADAGIGTDKYYESQVMFNRFKGNYKFSAYGTLANDGKTSLGFSDAEKLGTSNTSVILGDDGGGIGILISGGGDALDNGNYNGQGLPSAKTGGVHYDTKLNNGKATLSTNYKIGALSLNTDRETISQQNTQGSTFNTNSDVTSYAHTFRQKGDVTYNATPDPSTNFKIAADATFKNTEADNATNTEVDNGTTLLNRNKQTDNTKTDQQAFNASLLYNKKFKKPRRTISWNVSENYVQGTSNEFLYSDLFTAGKDSITDQYKPIKTVSSVLNSNLVYTEPLSKKMAVSINYGLGFNNSTSDKDSYNKSASGRYDIFDPVFSNDYKFNQLTNQLGANFNYTFTKGSFIFGSKVSDINFRQTDQQTGIVFKRDFVNWQPIATFRYRVTQSQNLNLQYNGGTTQPSISQIQPIRDNTNVESVVVGNPDLKPSFRNGFNANYSSYQPISGQNFSLNGNYSFITDQIINNTTINSTTGKATIQYVNLIGHSPYNYNFNINMGRKILGVSTSIGLNSSGSVSYAYQNGLLNTNTTHTYGANLNFNKSETKKYYFYISGGPSYTFQTQTLLANGNYNAATIRGSLEGEIFLPGKIELSSDFTYNYQAAVNGVPALYRRMWNAFLTKSFFKEENLKFILSGNNLLNQDQVNRNPSASGFTQTTTNTIKRFFMFTVTWDFTKFGTTASTSTTPAK